MVFYLFYGFTIDFYSRYIGKASGGIAAIEPVQEDPTWEAEALTPGLTAEEAQQEYKLIYGGDYSDVRGGFDLSEMERNR